MRVDQEIDVWLSYERVRSQTGDAHKYNGNLNQTYLFRGRVAPVVRKLCSFRGAEKAILLLTGSIKRD